MNEVEFQYVEERTQEHQGCKIWTGFREEGSIEPLFLGFDGIHLVADVVMGTTKNPTQYKRTCGNILCVARDHLEVVDGNL